MVLSTCSKVLGDNPRIVSIEPGVSLELNKTTKPGIIERMTMSALQLNMGKSKTRALKAIFSVPLRRLRHLRDERNTPVGMACTRVFPVVFLFPNGWYLGQNQTPVDRTSSTDHLRQEQQRRTPEGVVELICRRPISRAQMLIGKYRSSAVSPRCIRLRCSFLFHTACEEQNTRTNGTMFCAVCRSFPILND